MTTRRFAARVNLKRRVTKRCFFEWQEPFETILKYYFFYLAVSIFKSINNEMKKQHVDIRSPRGHITEKKTQNTANPRQGA